jgi:tetratricopeptide (TPR) repeat protein
MTFDDMIEQAWDDHADHAVAVADRLAAAAPTIAGQAQFAPFAGIVTHVYGEHLGECERGVALLNSLRKLPAFADTPMVGGVVTRGVATLRLVGGDAAAAAALDTEDRAAALAMAASALTARGEYARALDAYAQAVRIAPSLPAGSPAFRALAIGGNNLSASLEDKGNRTPSESEGMIAAARGGLAFWRKAGTWLEEERALYRLARSLLAAGQPGEAALCAQECAKICDEHNAPAFERFFASAVLARALREDGRPQDYRRVRNDALGWFDAVPDDEREWCEADLAELAY